MGSNIGNGWKSGLGAIKRDRAQVARAASPRAPRESVDRHIRPHARIVRTAAGDYAAMLCLEPFSTIEKENIRRLISRREQYRQRRQADVGTCGTGYGPTPTKALTEAAHGFARALGRRK